MRGRGVVLGTAAVLIGLIGAVLWASVSSSQAAPPNAFAAQMNGAAEVPGPGDPDGAGRAGVTVRGTQVCVLLHVQRIATATAAHIHRGAPNVAGPIVVTLPNPRPFAQGCVTVSGVLANEIRTNPSRFYVNVHNASFRAGAIRGQLFN